MQMSFFSCQKPNYKDNDVNVNEVHDDFVVQFKSKFSLLLVFFVGIFFHFTISIVRACALELNILIIGFSYLLIICM